MVARNPACPKVPGDGTFRALNNTVSSGPSDNWLPPTELAPERVVGVETGSCPHTAVRDDPSMNLDAVAERMRRFPDADVALVELGGDNLTLTFSGALADYFIFVIDVAEGEDRPRPVRAGRPGSHGSRRPRRPRS